MYLFVYKCRTCISFRNVVVGRGGRREGGDITTNKNKSKKREGGKGKRGGGEEGRREGRGIRQNYLKG